MPLSISISILLGMLLSLLVAPACIRLAKRWGMIDNPTGSTYKIHAIPTARAGGLVLFITVLAVGAITGTLLNPAIRTIFLASLAILATGIWDDAKGISALTKLCGQFIAGLILIQGGGAVQLFHYPPVDYALTLFWVIGITNAYNLVDSMDGQAIGLAGIAALFLMLATMNVGEGGSAAFAAVLIGACAGLAYYNLTPARLFLGDSGSQLLGFWLAGLGILYTPARSVPPLSSWFVPILLMLVPILDTTLVTTSRLRSGLPFYMANRDHTYHRLVALGVAPLHAVVLVLLASVLTGCLAFIALAMPPVWANAIFFGALAAGFVAILWMERGEGH